MLSRPSLTNEDIESSRNSELVSGVNAYDHGVKRDWRRLTSCSVANIGGERVERWGWIKGL